MSTGELDQTADAGTNAGAPTALAPGNQLGKYRLDRVLGEGGMGVVWAAHDPDLERWVAIKVLRYAQASQQLRQRLLREARAMAKLKHPNVLTVYEVGSVGERDYIAMELVDGMTLDQWLALEPPWEEIWTAVLAAGRGLSAAHEAGVVHRDFKPHNVLRSREGRVLVTDFGLARGMMSDDDDAKARPLDGSLTSLDTTMPARSASGRASDSVLDSPLTQTGAMIGTPAYMAPEQYAGAPPDPRTDQFAFCVTAWQALTGERPFKGQTLDEMRTSVGAGVAHVEAKLPRAVRSVLARGLDPVADRRHASLDTLLDELERAGRPARRPLIFVVTGMVALAAIGIGLGTSRSDDPAKTACDDPEAQFVEAWSPAIRSELARRTASENVVRIGETLDRYAERWVETYAKACRGRPGRAARQRIACLEGLRDRVSAITLMLRDVEPRVLAAFDARDAMPPLASCETAMPLAPPPVPKEQPRRGQILHLVGKSLAVRGMTTEQVGAAVDSLLADARALDWPPLVPIVLGAGANQYLRAHEPARARDLFQQAIASLPKQAALRDVRIEAMTYLGLLEASLAELENPGADVPAGIRDPKARVVLHDELAMRITMVTNAANGDPMLLGARSLLAAHAYTRAAQWNRYRNAYTEALRLAAEARKLFDEIGDVDRSARASAMEASIYLLRGDDRALDDALFAARRAQDALAAAQLPPLPSLDEVRARVAFARRDFTELHRIHDAYGAKQQQLPARTIQGRVVGTDVSVRVIAWHGELAGDPGRAYTDPRTLSGDVVQTAADGTFTVRAEPGWAIMAETRGQRSTPVPVTGHPVTLKLEPTITISGQIQGRNWFGVKAFARYAIGNATWTLHTPIDKDGAFDLRGLPPGTRTFGTEGIAGTGTRTVVAGDKAKDISWPYGQGIEIVVRAQRFDAGARAWLVRGRHAPRTRSELDALLANERDVAVSPLERVGARNTDAGREVYLRGDRHAVITGNQDDDYTACATALEGGAIACTPVAVQATVSIDYPDGRFGAGVTPVVIEL